MIIPTEGLVTLKADKWFLSSMDQHVSHLCSLVAGKGLDPLLGDVEFLSSMDQHVLL